MQTDEKSSTVVFDRRQVYRPFLERLNPLTSFNNLVDADLLIQRDHDPRDAGQPPIHVAFADSAELNRGTQMALVGGIGSGKTTELLFTERTLKRHSDAVNTSLDLAEDTKLDEINTGALLAAAGMRLHRLLVKKELVRKDLPAYSRIRELAFDTTKWVPEYEWEGDEGEEDDDGPTLIPVKVPGVIKPRFPAIKRDVKELKELLLTIAAPLIERDAQITLLIDGLDRLIEADRFRLFVEQDLRALRGTPISVIVVAPLMLWYDKSRFLQDYFDLVKHIPAAAAGPQDSAFLKKVLERRGAQELMDRPEIASIVKYSGGVIRDLLTLARSAAEYAYRDDKDRVGSAHVRAAINQLGNRYLVGLGRTHKKVLRRLIDNDEFPIGNSTAMELLANRQVLEYVTRGREQFAVHPALVKVLPKAE